MYKEQAPYEEAEPLLLEAVEARPDTLQSLNNLVQLNEAWNKPEKADEWRAKLPQTEAVEQ